VGGMSSAGDGSSGSSVVSGRVATWEGESSPLEAKGGLESGSDSGTVAFAGAFAVLRAKLAMDGCLGARAMGAERRGGKERVTMTVVVAERKNHG
jgi:hypothetical protein